MDDAPSLLSSGGRLICLVVLSKEVIDAAEALKEKDALFKMGITIETGERLADRPDEFIAQRFAYRCKECGKEWTKFKVQEVGTNREDVEDDEEKTDFDSGKEDEDAREEQYASER